MTLRIGETAPDFEAETTAGRIKFHDWIGNSWAVLFSHPKDFTPVCTTELGYMAKIKPEFERRNVKIIGISVDPVDRHSKWADDIKETQGHAPNYPMIGDPKLEVSKLYGMLPAESGSSSEGRDLGEALLDQDRGRLAHRGRAGIERERGLKPRAEPCFRQERLGLVEVGVVGKRPRPHRPCTLAPPAVHRVGPDEDKRWPGSVRVGHRPCHSLAQLDDVERRLRRCLAPRTTGSSGSAPPPP